MSVKPETYRLESHLVEDIRVRMIWYKKRRNCIEVDYSDLFR